MFFLDFKTPHKLSAIAIAIGLLGAFITVPQPAQAADITGGKTTAPAYANSLSKGYKIIPLLTVGDEVSLLEGDFGNFQANPNKKFAFAGIPDGLGVVETKKYNYVFVNHELDSDEVSYLNATDNDKIVGARVSLYQFDKNWNVVGGKNLIETVTDQSTGENFVLDTVSGLYKSATGAVQSFARFCSGYLAEKGFGNLPVWFAPEEVSEGRGIAIDGNGKGKTLDGLGRFSKEQVLATSQYRPDNSDTTVLLSTEDDSNGELYMWVGQKSQNDPNGFDKNSGKLYVLRVGDNDWETMQEGAALTATWTEVPKDIALGTEVELSDWVDTEGRSTNFRRPEDIHEDPNNPGTFYFVTTGRAEKPGGFEETDDPNEADNPYGKLYRLVLDPNNPFAPPKITLLHTGGFGKGVSYDNIVVDRNGKILIQEDETAFGGDVMTEEGRENSRVWAYDLASDSIKPLFEFNEGLFPDFNDPTAPGEWESSGIIEIDFSTQGRSSYLFDIQAHTIEDSRYVEGGQLILAQAQHVPEPGTITGLTVLGLTGLGWKLKKRCKTL
jgi:glycerophosphoryl diester phosphodiesterase